MAIDKEVIAEQYAKSVGKQVVEFCVNSDKYSYYRIDYSVRPRYIGHPHVIKIDNKGGIVRVKDLEEMYWALGNRSTTQKQ